MGKTAAWLSVVAGVLAALAFFGITSVSDLEREVNADKLDADACAYATKSLLVGRGPTYHHRGAYTQTSCTTPLRWLWMENCGTCSEPTQRIGTHMQAH